MKNPADILEHQWHTIASVIMHKVGLTKMTITREDMNSFDRAGYSSLIVNENDEGLNIYLLDPAGTASLVIQHVSRGNLK